MNIKLLSILRVRYGAYLFMIAALCCCSADSFAQEYTTMDSASFQQALAGSHTDAERITYQLQLAEYAIKKPGSTKSDLEFARRYTGSAERLNETVKSEEAEGHILLDKDALLRASGAAQKKKDLVLKAIGLLKNSSDKCLLGSAYKALSNYYSADDPQEVGTKKALTQQSLKLYHECGNRLEEALTLQDMAETNLASGQLSAALKNLNESQATLTALHYTRLQRLYNLLGIYYFISADYARCLKYQFQALDLCRQFKDSSSLYCEINNITGMCYMNLSQYDKAITAFSDALVVARKNNDELSIFSLSSNMAACYQHLKMPDEAIVLLNGLLESNNVALRDINTRVSFDCSYLDFLVQVKRYDKAKKWADELLHLITKPSVNKFNATKSYHALIVYYYLIKDYDKAEESLTNNEKLERETGIPDLSIQNLGVWYAVDSARKDYKNAFYHLLQFKNLNDSIYTVQQSKEAQQLQVKYETQKKEDDIKLLTQRTKTDAVQLKAARLTRNATLAGILVILIIVGLQYRNYRQKQKASRLIAEKNTALQRLVTEKEWLLKEVHHRVKNNLHTIICLLESQAAYLENDALKAIDNSRHRIYAMSLIHQKLYQSDDIKVVDMKMYLTEFVDYLNESFGRPEHIKLTLATDAIKLGATQAIPVGLIINEAINNAFKYAFPAQQAGAIAVTLKRVEDEIQLSVADNGIGFKQQDDQEINSLGLELIKGLALELRGTIALKTDNGTSIQIRFKTDTIDFMPEEGGLNFA